MIPGSSGQFGTAAIVIVVAGDNENMAPHVGLALTPDQGSICGAVTGTPAAEHDLEWHSERTGLPIDWEATEALWALKAYTEASARVRVYGSGKGGTRGA